MQNFTIVEGFPEDQTAVAARLYWDAFKGKIGGILRPERKALAFLERVLDPRFAISAVDASGVPLGLAGYKTADGSLVGGSLSELSGEFGWLGGVWRGLVLSILERETEPGELLMDGICVDAVARGHGVGTALLDAIKAEARRQGLQSVRLDVIDINPRARSLYERQGFVAGEQTDIGVLRHVFGFRHTTTMHCRVGRTC